MRFSFCFAFFFFFFFGGSVCWSVAAGGSLRLPGGIIGLSVLPVRLLVEGAEEPKKAEIGSCPPPTERGMEDD